MTFSFANSCTVDQLCLLFNTAFSDYVVPMVLTEPVLKLKLTRDGTSLAFSPLALEKETPVGFILNSLGQWQGKATAYNGGTGVVPQARGKALTNQLYQFCLPYLKEQGVEQLLLEVIQKNDRALAVYQSMGFKIVRSLNCYRQTKVDLLWHNHVPTGITYKKVETPNWPLYQSFWEVEPSWQHHTAAIDQSLPYVILIEARLQGKCVGYGALFELTGSLGQLAVAPAYRRKGIGQGLLQQLLTQANSTAVNVINVDEESESTVMFLEGRNIADTLSQYEMVKLI